MVEAGPIEVLREDPALVLLKLQRDVHATTCK